MLPENNWITQFESLAGRKGWTLNIYVYSSILTRAQYKVYKVPTTY